MVGHRVRRTRPQGVSRVEGGCKEWRGGWHDKRAGVLTSFYLKLILFRIIRNNPERNDCVDIIINRSERAHLIIVIGAAARTC